MTEVSLDPEFYKKTPKERFKFNNDIEDIINDKHRQVNENEIVPIKDLINYLIKNEVKTHAELMKTIQIFQRKYKLTIRKNKVLMVLMSMLTDGELEITPEINLLRGMLVKKAGKSQSGVLVITVVTSPYPDGQRFSCKYDCFYCPNEPKQVRSYLHDEPSVIRANRNNFDPVLQFYDRAYTLMCNGHPVDKIEILVLGGTWSNYPKDYQKTFIRDLFYAANTFYDQNKREKFNLSQEKTINESAKCKIIGLTLETRPDQITPNEIKQLRQFGCTRVQLGVQHIDNKILKKINRGCNTGDTIKSLKLLKENGFKVDIHLMPNLPDSNPVKDIFMFNRVLNDPKLQADQWKIYPCETVPWTKIQKWHQEGKYKPYTEKELTKVLIHAITNVHPWIRLNRVVRDIPSQYIIAGVDNPSMRQDIEKEIKSKGMKSMCIRAREIKGETIDPNDIQLFVRTYQAQRGIEYFISFESKDQSKILGFCRLRINSEFNELPIFPELENSALVRELHVYGQLKQTNEFQFNLNSFTQHKNLGKKLMQKAEKIAKSHNCGSVAVISGVGVRNYYKKLGYELTGESEFMIKKIKSDYNYRNLSTFIALLFLSWIIFYS